MSEQLTSEQRTYLGLEGKFEVLWINQKVSDKGTEDKRGFYRPNDFDNKVENLVPAYKSGVLIIKRNETAGSVQTCIEGFPNRTAQGIDFTHYHLGSAVNFRLGAEEDIHYAVCPVSLFRQENYFEEHIDSEKDIPI